LAGISKFHSVNFTGSKKAVEMCPEAENGRSAVGVVAPYSFKNAAAVVQGVAEDVKGGIGPRHHRAIPPNKRGHHRHQVFRIGFLQQHLCISQQGKSSN